MTATIDGRRRRRAFVALGLCGAAVVAIVVLALVLSENVVYFRTVSEAVADRHSQGHDRFRLAGAVVPGTIVQTAHGVRFKVTDGKATATVVHDGDPPELFKAGAPVVCEGAWGSGLTFDSDRIMIRHGSDYTPPKVDTQQAGTTR
jgi:cytochrome c-type biogenesis protein CcmE